METERNMVATAQNSAIRWIDRDIIAVGETDRVPPAPNRPTFSIIAHVRDEEAVLPELHQRVAAVMDGTSSLVPVNDGSRDRSTDIIGEPHARDARVVGLSLSRNFDFQIAVAAGLDRARGDAVILIDADLQDPPELIAR